MSCTATEDRVASRRADGREKEALFFAGMPMMTANAMLTLAHLPIIWRFRLVLHGVRLSRLAHDDLDDLWRQEVKRIASSPRHRPSR